MSAFNSGLPNQPDKVVPPPTPANLTTIVVVGPGSFVPRASTKWMRVTLLGGGGGGGALGSAWSGNASGGQAGQPMSMWMLKTQSAYAYQVGQAGVAGAAGGPISGTAGGNTTFGSLTAYGGLPGTAQGSGANSYEPRGQSCCYGQGGVGGGGFATGYGAGGGGAVSSNAPGGNGSGGLLIIEEY